MSKKYDDHVTIGTDDVFIAQKTQVLVTF